MLGRWDRAGPDGRVNGDHARIHSKHRATTNAARSHSTLSGVWPDFGRCPDSGRKPDMATQGRCSRRCRSPEPGVITYEYRKGRLVPVPVPGLEPATERGWRWELQPLTPMQKQAIVTTTVGGAMLIIMMILLSPVGA
jgi:hypothetical protein